MQQDKRLTLLGKKITAARVERGLTQTAFANSIGKDQPSIARIENGNINPSYLYLLDVAAGLEMTLQQLLDYPIPTNP